MIRHLRSEQFVGGDPARIWAFFSTPLNLAAITPPRMRFQILGAPPAQIYAGQLIEYRVGILPGLATSWLTEITHVRDGEYFIDEQRIGPYRLWHHEHRFRPAPGGLQMLDDVAYDVGWGPLGDIVEKVWVRRQLVDIFEFRRARIARLFPLAG